MESFRPIGAIQNGLAAQTVSDDCSNCVRVFLDLFFFDQFLTSSSADMDIFPFGMYSAVQL